MVLHLDLVIALSQLDEELMPPLKEASLRRPPETQLSRAPQSAALSALEFFPNAFLGLPAQAIVFLRLRRAISMTRRNKKSYHLISSIRQLFRCTSDSPSLPAGVSEQKLELSFTTGGKSWSFRLRPEVESWLTQ